MKEILEWIRSGVTAHKGRLPEPRNGALLVLRKLNPLFLCRFMGIRVPLGKWCRHDWVRISERRFDSFNRQLIVDFIEKYQYIGPSKSIDLLVEGSGLYQPPYLMGRRSDPAHHLNCNFLITVLNRTQWKTLLHNSHGRHHNLDRLMGSYGPKVK